MINAESKTEHKPVLESQRKLLLTHSEDWKVTMSNYVFEIAKVRQAKQNIWLVGGRALEDIKLGDFVQANGSPEQKDSFEKNKALDAVAYQPLSFASDEQHHVREPASTYHLSGSGIFSLAPGGFEAHEGHIILTSRDQEKEIHVLEKHGTSVTAAFLKSRLSGVLNQFYRIREQKVANWENALVAARLKQARQAIRSRPDPMKVLSAYEEIQKLQQKIAWARGIQSNQRDKIMRLLHDEARRKEIPFRATKFYKSDLMRQTVMTVLASNQEQIDAQLTDKNGNPKPVATEAGPFRHQFSRNIGIGYELNEKMQIVEIATLTKVAVMLIISDQRKRHYKVLTAYPEP